MVVVAILGVLVASAAPSFRRSIEQSRADVAVVNLRTFWTAQRVYWLKTRTFADDWDKLWVMKLIDKPITKEDDDPPHAKHYTKYYTYEISDVDPNNETFRITARRVNNSSWSGEFEIDQTGTIKVTIESGRVIKPGFQD
ncbi:MAG: hypothetical protein GX621_04975 [Pirellulaceae bacterium]|nr:hypothetical protein [Pirellulaceae bacterium]